jgi:hypothetical protein
MKNVFLLLCLAFSFQLSASTVSTNPVSDEQSNLSLLITPADLLLPSTTITPAIGEYKLAACVIIRGCGAQAQWCDEGLHGDFVTYVNNFYDHFCGQES